MQRWIPILAAVLCAQLLIAGALALRKDALATRPPSAPFVTAPIGTADQIAIEGPAKAAAAAPRVVLQKRGTNWVVHSDYDVPVGKSKVADLLRRFTALRRGLAIADTPQALRRFKVDGHRFARRLTFSRGGKMLATVYLGESTGLHQSDARTNGERAVYTVGVATYDVPATGTGWIDAQMLQIPSDDIVALDVGGTSGAPLRLTRKLVANGTPGPWTAAALPRGRSLDATKIAALTRAIDEMRVDKVLGERANPDWQAGHPQLTLTIESAATKATATAKATIWTLSKPKSGDFVVLKSSAQPWYFSLNSGEAQPLLDAAEPGGLFATPPGKTHAKKVAGRKIPPTGAPVGVK
ncbi:MAG TPA: DUF4340 domain-containing protein [Steroidobacteraceae bacterium]|nr:DUF4340 domain-containing protein [Steroidobacteraceae bacterium]